MDALIEASWPLNGNLGTHASILTMNVSTLAGNDVAASGTGADQIGWQIAMLQTPPVPEPGTLIGLCFLTLVRLRWKRAVQ